MKRINAFALVVFAIMFYPVILFAQGTEEKKEPVAPEQTKEKTSGQEYIGGMAMRMMGLMQKQMVATNDGGVIVLMGNKLFKYDKDLNLIKEVEIKAQDELKVDVGSMQDMMKMMKERYGRHGKDAQGESPR